MHQWQIADLLPIAPGAKSVWRRITHFLALAHQFVTLAPECSSVYSRNCFSDSNTKETSKLGLGLTDINLLWSLLNACRGHVLHQVDTFPPCTGSLTCIMVI